MNKRSLPQQTESLSLSDCGDVEVAADTFAHCAEITDIEFAGLKSLDLGQHFYSRKEGDFGDVRNFTVSRVGRVVIRPQAFVNFPKATNVVFSEVGLERVTEKALEVLTDLLVIKESAVGVLESGSVYSDAMELSFRNNRIEVIEEAAFDASVRRFDFVGNTVDYIAHSGMSVACLFGKVVGNTFRNQTGSPLLDFGPGIEFEHG